MAAETPATASMSTLEPDRIARAEFGTGFRGYEQSEVRSFLARVAGELNAVRARETELRARVDELEADLEDAESGGSSAPRKDRETDRDLDEARMAELLGEETTKILQSAREAAATMRSKAESEADEILEAAEEEAAATRSEAEGLLTLRTTEADAAAAEIAADAEKLLAKAGEDAEAELDQAKSEGKRMVAEAKAMRERVLTDMAHKRNEQARQQIERLRAGRERLLESYEIVRETLDQATAELNGSLTEARIAADRAARQVDLDDIPSMDALEEEVATAKSAGVPLVDLDEDIDLLDEDEDENEDEDEAAEIAVDLDDEADDAVGDGASDEDIDDPEADAEVIDLAAEAAKASSAKKLGTMPTVDSDQIINEPQEFEGVRIIGAVPADEADADDENSDVDDLFARLRAESEGDAATGETEVIDLSDADDASDGAEVDDGDAADAPIETAKTARAPKTPTTAKTATPAARKTTKKRKAPKQAKARAKTATRSKTATNTEARAAVTTAAGTAAVTAVDKAAPKSEPTESTPDTTAATPEQTLLRRRDAVIDGAVRDMSRQLKRVLSDDQNKVLELLRDQGDDFSLDGLDRAQQLQAYRSKVEAGLSAAAEVGRGFIDADGGGVKVAVELTDLIDELTNEIVDDLRSRVDTAVGSSDGGEVEDRVRATFRELRNRQINELSDYYVISAFSRGELASVGDGAAIHWLSDGCGPDCQDNALAGDVAAGTAFPTGHFHPPTHVGCRCLVVPSDDGDGQPNS